MLPVSLSSRLTSIALAFLVPIVLALSLHNARLVPVCILPVYVSLFSLPVRRLYELERSRPSVRALISTLLFPQTLLSPLPSHRILGYRSLRLVSAVGTCSTPGQLLVCWITPSNSLHSKTSSWTKLAVPWGKTTWPSVRSENSNRVDQVVVFPDATPVTWSSFHSRNLLQLEPNVQISNKEADQSFPERERDSFGKTSLPPFSGSVRSGEEWSALCSIWGADAKANTLASFFRPSFACTVHHQRVPGGCDSSFCLCLSVHDSNYFGELEVNGSSVKGQQVSWTA